MMRGSAITVVSNTAAEIKLIAIVRVFISCPPVQHQSIVRKKYKGGQAIARASWSYDREIRSYVILPDSKG
jgi:hypothetical protein